MPFHCRLSSRIYSAFSLKYAFQEKVVSFSALLELYLHPHRSNLELISINYWFYEPAVFEHRDYGMRSSVSNICEYWSKYTLFIRSSGYWNLQQICLARSCKNRKKENKTTKVKENKTIKVKKINIKPCNIPINQNHPQKNFENDPHLISRVTN